MSATPRKPLSTGATVTPRRTSIDPMTQTKTPTGSAVPSSIGQGLARTPSLRQTRPVRKAASRSSTSLATDLEEDGEDSRASNGQLIAELRQQVERAEQASENYRKQLEVLQKRLDDLAEEQTSMEEREQQRQTELDTLRIELKETARQRRELEHAHEAEKSLILRERDRQASKEAELQTVISRLNESLRVKDHRRISPDKTSTFQDAPSLYDEGQASAQAHNHTDASNLAEAVAQKDSTIDALTLELAESQIRIAEMEHMGDGRLQELEKTLMETRMEAARLREDNESFQFLLSEKTLKGDFLHDTRTAESTAGMSSLAEELESAGDDADGQSEGYKKLEAEVKNLREGNKALTLYIDKIIGRLLQHEGFEHIILDNSDPPEVPTKASAVEKALPATPMAQSATSLLQRAKSVVSRPGPKARPVSYMPPSATTANENPETAPSIPLNRGHRRARSDQAQKDMGAAALVQQMNRGSPLRTVSGGAMSPGISPLSPQLNPVRASYFQSAAPPSTRTTSLSGPIPKEGERGSSANSLASEQSFEKDSTDASSAQTNSHGLNSIPGAVMKQNQLRPLRLVREQTEEQEAQKRANRSSTWMGWLKGSSLEANNTD